MIQLGEICRIGQGAPVVCGGIQSEGSNDFLPWPHESGASRPRSCPTDGHHPSITGYRVGHAGVALHNHFTAVAVCRGGQGEACWMRCDRGTWGADRRRRWGRWIRSYRRSHRRIIRGPIWRIHNRRFHRRRINNWWIHGRRINNRRIYRRIDRRWINNRRLHRRTILAFGRNRRPILCEKFRLPKIRGPHDAGCRVANVAPPQAAPIGDPFVGPRQTADRRSCLGKIASCEPVHAGGMNSGGGGCC